MESDTDSEESRGKTNKWHNNLAKPSRKQNIETRPFTGDVNCVFGNSSLLIQRPLDSQKQVRGHSQMPWFWATLIAGTFKWTRHSNTKWNFYNCTLFGYKLLLDTSLITKPISSMGVFMSNSRVFEASSLLNSEVVIENLWLIAEMGQSCWKLRFNVGNSAFWIALQNRR